MNDNYIIGDGYSNIFLEKRTVRSKSTKHFIPGNMPGEIVDANEKPEIKKKDSKKEIDNYLRENLLAICIGGDQPFAYITRETFDNYVSSDEFSNCVIVDILNNNSFDCNHNGDIIGSRLSNEFESTFTIYTALGTSPSEDIFGNLIPIPLLEEEGGKNKKTHIGDAMSIAFISLIEKNIRKFYQIENSSKLPLESSIDILIKTAVIDPNQFDEIFTIEKDRPESPLMRKFLIKLSELVNKELETLQDEGLENMESLQKNAYEYAGYKGKTLETVIEEQKDYDAYFRFLLTKDEKIVITEEQKDYFDKLKDIIKKELPKHYATFVVPTKKKNKDVELTGISVAPMLSGSMYFKGLVPCLILSKSVAKATYFTYVDDIYDVYDQIDKSELSLKVALNHDLILEDLGDLKQGVEVQNLIFVCDKNFNYAFFKVKKSTLNKWKKSLSEKIINLPSIMNSGSMIPRGFNEFVL